MTDSHFHTKEIAFFFKIASKFNNNIILLLFIILAFNYGRHWTWKLKVTQIK